MLDGAGVKVYLQRDNLGRRMREHRLMVVKYVKCSSDNLTRLPLDGDADGDRRAGAPPRRFAGDLDDVEAAQQRANHHR